MLHRPKPLRARLSASNRANPQGCPAPSSPEGCRTGPKCADAGQAGQFSGFDISVLNSVCCCLRRRQVGLDVVVVTLSASAAYRGRDGSKDQIEEDAARRVLQCPFWDIGGRILL